MELKIDLLYTEKKSIFRIILGIAILVVSVGWIIARSKDYQHLNFLDWLFAGFMILNGISHTLGGSGYAINRLFGKAFVEIDENIILIKPTLFDKTQEVAWRDIASMEYMANKYRITLTDGKIVILHLSKLEYLLKKNIKEAIGAIAAAKGISGVSIHPS